MIAELIKRLRHCWRIVIYGIPDYSLTRGVLLQKVAVPTPDPVIVAYQATSPKFVPGLQGNGRRSIKAEIKVRSSNKCEVCKTGPFEHIHHLKAEDPKDLLACCESCHKKIHRELRRKNLASPRIGRMIISEETKKGLNKSYYTLNETAEILCISERTVRRNIKTGVIPANQISGRNGKEWRVPHDFIASHLESSLNLKQLSPQE